MILPYFPYYLFLYFLVPLLLVPLLLVPLFSCSLVAYSDVPYFRVKCFTSRSPAICSSCTSTTMRKTEMIMTSFSYR